MPTVTCPKCDKKFSKTTLQRAEQALRMHVGRSHSGSIARAHPLGLPAPAAEEQPVSGSGRRMSPKQASKVIAFIRKHSAKFNNRTDCFRAALRRAHMMNFGSSYANVERYFDKAGIGADGNNEPKARAQTHEIRVDFCPACGCNLRAVATGMAMALHEKG
jgi:hypothetical protein